MDKINFELGTTYAQKLVHAINMMLDLDLAFGCAVIFVDYKKFLKWIGRNEIDMASLLLILNSDSRLVYLHIHNEQTLVIAAHFLRYGIKNILSPKTMDYYDIERMVTNQEGATFVHNTKKLSGLGYEHYNIVCDRSIIAGLSGDAILHYYSLYRRAYYEAGIKVMNFPPPDDSILIALNNCFIPHKASEPTNIKKLIVEYCKDLEHYAHNYYSELNSNQLN